MNQNSQIEIKEILIKSKLLIILGIIIILVLPFILTLPALYNKLNFTETGQIGDTIGGITAPFLNLIGAILIFYALKAQIRANIIIHNQLEFEKTTREAELEATNLNHLYSYLNESISNFKFTSLPVDTLKNINNTTVNIEFNAGEAINHLLTQIRCNFHHPNNNLRDNQSVSELISIMKIMKVLLIKLETTTSNNKEVLIILVQHLFDYKMMNGIRDLDDRDLVLDYCSDCQAWHGYPKELLELIIEVRRSLKSLSK